MKKISILLLILLLATIFLPFNHVSAAAKAGIKPGSIFYFFDTAFEKINLFFTFNPEKKAQKNLEYADERLAEAEAVANEKNTDAVKTAVAGYESNIASATEESKQIKDKVKTEELLNSIADNTSKHQEVLADVLNKVPGEAKDAITKAIEASRKGQEEAMNKIVELKGEIEQLKKEVAELKAKDEEQGKTNEELNKQKSENVPALVKPSSPKNSEVISVPKPVATPSQSQTQTQASEPQSTQPIIQPPSNTTNTTPTPTPIQTPICTPNWQCGGWSTCTNSQQTRICIDSNSCGITTGQPILTQFCTVARTPNWQCGSWGSCANTQQLRVCIDSNNCGTLINKPTESQSCIPPLSISNIRIVDTTTHSARFSWETNQDTYGIVILTNCPDENDPNCVNFVWGEKETQSTTYGYSSATNSQKLTDEGYFAERTNRTYTKQHQLNFMNLNLGNNYYYRIISINEKGEMVASPNNIGTYYAKF